MGTQGESSSSNGATLSLVEQLKEMQTKTMKTVSDGFAKTIETVTNQWTDFFLEFGGEVKSNTTRICKLEKRLEALEKKNTTPGPNPRSGGTAQTDEQTALAPTLMPIPLENGKFLCPKCLKDYTAGYIRKHMNNLTNRNCVRNES